jgi:hypothetical protein
LRILRNTFSGIGVCRAGATADPGSLNQLHEPGRVTVNGDALDGGKEL